MSYTSKKLLLKESGLTDFQIDVVKSCAKTIGHHYYTRDPNWLLNLKSKGDQYQRKRYAQLQRFLKRIENPDIMAGLQIYAGEDKVISGIANIQLICRTYLNATKGGSIATTTAAPPEDITINYYASIPHERILGPYPSYHDAMMAYKEATGGKNKPGRKLSPLV